MPTKNKKQNLLPELRFPEFREAGEWEEMQLGMEKQPRILIQAVLASYLI